MEFSNVFVSATREYSTYEKSVPSPYFRKSFILNEVPSNAEITITGLGFYALFVNGREITKGLLAPYISNPDQYVYYDTYAISEYLTAGENVIGVQLGNGLINNLNKTWSLDKALFRSAPKFACEVVCGDVAFDASAFKWEYSPLYFDGLREGNFYDARNEIPNWNKPGFDDSMWHEPVAVESPRGEKRLCPADPIAKICEHKPIRVFKGTLSENINKSKDNSDFFEGPIPREGGYIYDFGLNMTGISRLKIKGKPGQKIRLQYYDRLVGTELDRISIQFSPDGYFQSDLFICSGGEDVFEQRFAYYGYQYCYVWGITEEQATEDLLTAIEAHSDIKKIGDFSCSDEVANRLYNMVQRSDITNFVYFPTDCPHREKNGWTGDISMSMEHMILNYDTNNSMREWLFNLRKAQKENGELPGIVPTETWGYGKYSGTIWDSVLFNVPYMLYIYRKDKEVILENAHAMLNYLEFISRKRDADGIIQHGLLGEWACINGEPERAAVPLGLVHSLLAMDICKKAAEMFEDVGLHMSKTYADTLYGEVREAARKKYIDFSTMIAGGSLQACQAPSIYFGLFNKDEEEKAFAALMDIIHRDGDSMQGGFLCLRVLFHLLTKFGESDLAYHMICKREFPSYGYLVDWGLTTLPEALREDLNKVGSFNHHFFGDISHWFVSAVAGINILKDKVVIKPHFIKKLDYAQASYELATGETLRVRWDRINDQHYTIKVSGAEAELVLPDGFVQTEEKDGLYKIEKL